MSTNMTVSKWIVYMRNIVKILRDNRLSFSYNLNDHAIYTTDGSNITPHLMAVYDEISKVEDEYWREKICKAHNIPIDILFPTEKKKTKYRFKRDKKSKVYISGPITGRDEKEYMNDFNSTELWLTGLGYDVVNPVSDGIVEGWGWSDYMRRDIKLLCDCDYIYFIKGWENSKGCCLESSIAFQLGIKVLCLDESGKAV